jgi:hypothetical protein
VQGILTGIMVGFIIILTYAFTKLWVRVSQLKKKI